jgi:acyl carrier protein
MSDELSLDELTLEVMSRCLDLSVDSCKEARWRETEAWDSFAFVEIVAELEERLGISLSEADIENVSDYRDLAATLQKATGV